MLAALAESDAADTTMRMIDSTIVRAHQHAAGGKGGFTENAIGRSRGGLTTKLHTRTDAQGLAIGFCLTPGQASDMAAYEDLMQQEAPDPSAMLFLVRSRWNN